MIPSYANDESPSMLSRQAMKTLSIRLQALPLLTMIAFTLCGQDSVPTASPPLTSAQQFHNAFQLIQALEHPDAQMLGTCTADGCWAPTTLLTDSTAELARQLEPAIQLTILGAKTASNEKASLHRSTEHLIGLSRQTKSLVGMLALKARHEFQAGRAKTAVDLLLTAITTARYSEGRLNFMGKLIEIGASNLALQTLSSLLPELPKEELGTLKARLDALPPAAPIADVIRAEFQFGLLDSKKRNQQFGPNQSMHDLFSQLEPFYEALAKGSQTDPDSFKRLIETETVKYKKNLLVNHLGPLIASQHSSAIAEETRWAILRAAIDVALLGPETIKSTQELYGTQAFTLEKQDTGFAIQSTLEYRNQPIRLHFGE